MLAAASVLTFLMLVGAEKASAANVAAYLHAQRLVDVNGRRVNLYCIGAGSPAVVLDNDGDDSTIAWRFVQPAIARVTRVCSYDSRGIGFSDLGRPPLDAATLAGDLHALLARAGVAPPYLLVAYGISGLSDRLYADRYPHEVAGMVMVDPTVPNQSALMAEALPALAPMLAQSNSYEKCAEAAERGDLRRHVAAFEECTYSPPGSDLSRSTIAFIQREWEQPNAWRSLAWSDRAEAVSSAEVLREQRGYGKMPLIVLTSDVSAEQLPFTPAQIGSLTRAWKKMRDDVASLSSVGTNFVVSGATVNMAVDRPVDIVSAIREVLEQSVIVSVGPERSRRAVVEGP
jgi:pimeloyl-ACP methyl ester carboxylesterase